MTSDDPTRDTEREPAPRAAQKAHDNAQRSPDDYDDEGRPAASRGRDPEPGAEPGAGT